MSANRAWMIQNLNGEIRTEYEVLALLGRRPVRDNFADLLSRFQRLCGDSSARPLPALSNGQTLFPEKNLDKSAIRRASVSMRSVKGEFPYFFGATPLRGLAITLR
jgi:hypothetical protein